MTRRTPERAADDSAAELEPAIGNRELLVVIARFVAVLSAVLLIAITLAHFARAECEAIARHFVVSYGYWGMALGTLLADGFHFPIPPQFYMLLAIAARAPISHSFSAIALASLLAGFVGYEAASLAARSDWIRARTEGTRNVLERAVRRFGLQAALLASLLPVPYSVLCYLAGMMRLPRRFLVLLCLCRIPKLAMFYWLLLLGWHPG
jgi:membrane protein YqaA with SNARE-associated domain